MFPNIYGSIDGLFDFSANGALFPGNLANRRQATESEAGKHSVNLDASRSSSVYSSSQTTVQPSALRSLALIRAY